MFVTLMKINYAIFQEINESAGANPWLDACMVFCANSLILLFPLLLIMMWGRPVNWRKHPIQQQEMEQIQQRRAAVLWTGIACVVAYGINLLIEQFVFEPRPFVSHRVHVLTTHTADSSFPSDHTAWAFAVVGMLLFQILLSFTRTYRQQKRDEQKRSSWRFLRLPLSFLILTIIVASSIGVARIFVGVHYPGDVLGGAIDGLVGAFLVTLLRLWLTQPTNALLQLAHRLRLA